MGPPNIRHDGATFTYQGHSTTEWSLIKDVQYVLKDRALSFQGIISKLVLSWDIHFITLTLLHTSSIWTLQHITEKVKLMVMCSLPSLFWNRGFLGMTGYYVDSCVSGSYTLEAPNSGTSWGLEGRKDKFKCEISVDSNQDKLLPLTEQKGSHDVNLRPSGCFVFLDWCHLGGGGAQFGLPGGWTLAIAIAILVSVRGKDMPASCHHEHSIMHPLCWHWGYHWENQTQSFYVLVVAQCLCCEGWCLGH